MNKCIIMGAGTYCGEPIIVNKGDLVIAADGGVDTLLKLGIAPHQIIGDFDSALAVPTSPNVTRLPVEKDDTDMLAALRMGVRRGYELFHLHGGTGGRLDHTLANIQCLGWLAAQGLRGYLFDQSCAITCVSAGEIRFRADKGSTVSVFCLGDEATGVTLEGLKYPLTDGRLTCRFPIGVSNEATGGISRISVKKGALIICLPRECAASQ